jgi:hypothetical protein
MRPVVYFVSGIGDHWEIRCRADPAHPNHPGCDAAIEAAKRAALRMWEQQRVATEVMLDGDDGRWIRVATYGELLSPR